MTDTGDLSGKRRTSPVPGLAVVAAGLASLLMVAVHGTCSGGGVNLALDGFRTLFGPGQWVLAGTLLALGVVMLLPRLSAARGPTAAAATVIATMLVGTAVVAYRHWEPAAGMGGCGVWNNQPTLKTLAVLTVLADVAAAALALRSLLGGARTGPTRVSRGRDVNRTVALLVGVVVAVSLPLSVGSGNPETQDLTSYGAYALLWSLPWGAALLLSGWLPTRQALAVFAAVLLGAVCAADPVELVSAVRPAVATVIGVLGVVVVGLSRVVGARSSAADRPEFSVVPRL